MGHRGFTTKRYLWISRPLWATYVGTPEQNPSSILISELIKVRNWVVENFDGISPGLICSEIKDTPLDRFTGRVCKKG